MSALDWVRSKAGKRPVEFMTVTQTEEGEEALAGTWRVTRWHFKGRLPSRMVYQLRDEQAHNKLEKTFDGAKQVNETLKIGGQYRSEFNDCEFSRTEYERVETGSIAA